MPISGYIAVTALVSLVCAYFLAKTFRRSLAAEPMPASLEAGYEPRGMSSAR